MWSKITTALKPLTSSKEESTSRVSHSEVLNKVYEQHPNLSMFHPNESGQLGRQSVDGHSPSVHNKRNMFKRLSKPALKEDQESSGSQPLPQQPPPTNSKRTNYSLDFLNQDISQGSSGETQQVPRRSSFDMLRPSPPRNNQDTTKSVNDSRRRPSIDLLRDDLQRSQGSIRIRNDSVDNDFLSPGSDKVGHSSVRSILRDRNTPGRGQSVRFFSRNEFKVITPDHSLTTDYLDKPQPPIPDAEQPLVEGLTQSAQPSSGSPSSITRNSPGLKTRPKLAGLFAPFDEQENSGTNADTSLSVSPNVPTTNEFPNLFDVSDQLEMPSFPPPGLDFDVNAAAFGSTSFDASVNDISYIVREESLDGPHGRMTSTPPKLADLKGKGKEKAVDELKVPVLPPAVNETIFHCKEKIPKLASPLHDRSQSFSFGETVFFSLGNKTEGKSSEEMEAAYPSSDIRPSVDDVHLSMPAPSPEGATKARTRALSDTAFQDMLRASSKSVLPEADINDESGANLIVYSGSPSEPDPFSVNANTYYTPQVMIPTTPPKGAMRHLRKTSKEESLIISLQTQLSLKTELCAQYETDLKARDELVEILGKKLADIEKDEAKKKAALRSWRKKVQELEKACRQLEEAMDRSRQESMERSVMDEASGEALRMLHRQIASLENEKSEWVKKECALREDLETLETLVKEKSEDVMDLKETLWDRDEIERELKNGLREAKEQIDMIGNISMVGVDEEELKRLMMEREQKSSEETQRFKTKELELRQEVDEMKTKNEWLEVQKKSLEEQTEGLTQQLKVKEEEFATLKAELEAQWQHTEKMSEKIEISEQENMDLVAERDALKADVENLEVQISNMENDWMEGENKRNELEAELQEVWNLKDALEQERMKLEDSLQQECKTAEERRNALQGYENRIQELEQEQQFANDRMSHLEDKLRQRDEEVDQYTRRVVSGKTELEQLREEMSKLKREHSHVVGEQTRALQDAADQKEAAKVRMEQFVRAKEEAEVDLKTNRDRVGALMDEVERLRRQVHTFQQDSADKDIKIVQMTKQVSQDKEDILGLNMALESKQQELELMKRKMNVRGTAGSTPAQPSKVNHRRDSGIFTVTPLSRPSSVMSESGTDAGQSSSTMRKERKNSNETSSIVMTAKLALAKSSRANGGGSGSQTPSTIKGSMGPPSLKSRPSINGTPTPAARAGISRVSSVKASVISPTRTPVVHRKASSSANADNTPARGRLSRSTVNASPAPSSVSEQDEKENINSTSLSARRRNPISNLA